MSHLLAISVGPVQEFIAAARRTRDLWFGSYLLSEISKAVAAIVRSHGTLIFPHPETDLEPGDDKINVANVILAEITSNALKDIVAAAKAAAQTRWQEFAEQARGQVQKKAPAILRDDIWHNQVGDVIEFYAAWVPHTDKGNYQADRGRVMRLLAGRKNCRDFQQPGFDDSGLPKSSLDGQRPTVLVGPREGESVKKFRENWPEEIRRELRLAPGEQLDVVGLTKRLGQKGKRDVPRYSSVARVAAETWLRGVQVQQPGKLQLLREACERLVRKGLTRVREEKYEDFPYEGTVIYRDRHTDLKRELGLDEHDLDDVTAALKQIGGEPFQYVAVLVADGDSMGAALSRLDSAEDHRTLSKKLAAFARGASTDVTEHSGVLVYAGGDDVLAFAPVHTCLQCARALRERFYRETEMTLSVGIAIGHFMENLEDLRAYGQQAEKAAKAVTGKDALAVHLHKRGGAPVKVSDSWKSRLDDRLQRFAELIRDDGIPSKLPYELREMARVYEAWTDETAVATAIRSDLNRLLSQKQSTGDETVRAVMDPYTADLTVKKLVALSQELLVARLIATALKQSGEVPR